MKGIFFGGVPRHRNHLCSGRFTLIQTLAGSWFRLAQRLLDDGGVKHAAQSLFKTGYGKDLLHACPRDY